MKKIMNQFESPAEFFTLCLIFITAAYFFVGSFQFSDSDEVFPRLTSGATLICTIAYCVKCCSAKRAQEQKARKEKSAANQKATVITIVLFLSYLVAVWLFGFILATAAFSMIYPLASGYKKKFAVVLLPVVNVGFVLLFQKLMSISLGRGLLIDLTPVFF